MGNQSSIFSSGAALTVEFDKGDKAYSSGGAVSGKVYLSVEKDSVTADSLDILFTGNESSKVGYDVQVRDIDGKGSHRERRHAYESVCFLSLSFPLTTYAGGHVGRGRYCYPFSFQLPPCLPGRREIFVHDHYFKLHYFMEVRLHRTGFMTWDVKNKREVLIVDQPAPAYVTPMYTEPTRTPIKFFCCFDSGSITMGAKLDNTHLALGEACNCDFVVANHSTSRIKAVEVRIHQHIDIRAMSHTGGDTTQTFTRRIEAQELMKDMSINPEKKGEFTDDNATYLLTLLQKGAHRVAAPVTGFAGFAGSLASVTHEMHFQVKTPFCVDDPELQFPLYISTYRSAQQAPNGWVPEIETPIQRPPEWNYITSPVVNINPVPSAPPMPSNYAPPQGMMGGGGAYNDNRMMPSPSSPAAQGVPTDTSSVMWLIYTLQQGNAYTSSATLREWVTYGNLTQVTQPGGIEGIYQSIKMEALYSDFAHILGKALKENDANSVTCALIARAAGSFNTNNLNDRVSVLNAFASYCCDKNNATHAFAGLGLTPYMQQAVNLQYMM